MGEALASTTNETLAGAAVFFLAAVAALAVVLSRLEFGKAARRRRRLRQALARTERTRAAAAAARQAGALTPAEVARLAAFRSRVAAGRPAAPAGWWGRTRALWRQGYAGLIVAVLVGAFSMATHFGAFWLIAGGGWLGAIVITLLATALVVAACVWIGLGLLGSN